MRLPYAPTTAPPTSSPETSSIYARIASRRHPRPLIPLDLTLLHSPPIADGWNHLLGAIRSSTILSPALLELAICRIAVLNHAVYEWNAHAPLALKAGLDARWLSIALGEGQGEVEGEGEKERAVLRYTEEMTRDVKVGEETFGRLRALFSEREIVELTVGVAGYNMVSRVLVALDVGENNGKEMKSVEELVRELAKRQ